MRRERPLILSVDDEPASLALLHKILASEGYDVVEATDGESTLRAIAEASPTTLARMRTGRRPSASDRPPVGSSRASTTRPWMLNTSPISVSDSPRDSASRTVTGMSSPVGSQRSAIRAR